MFGDTITHDRLIRQLAVGTGAAVVFPTTATTQAIQFLTNALSRTQPAMPPDQPARPS